MVEQLKIIKSTKSWSKNCLSKTFNINYNNINLLYQMLDIFYTKINFITKFPFFFTRFISLELWLHFKYKNNIKYVLKEYY